MNTSDVNCQIHEATWIGLLQSKIGNITRMLELANWAADLKRSNINLPQKIHYLLTQYESLVQHKDLLFKDFKTDEAKLIFFKEYLSEKTMHFFPHYKNENLLENYIAKFLNIIPSLQNWIEEWKENNDYNLFTLFFTIAMNISIFDKNALLAIFKVVDFGLLDPNEIVQADITRSFLIDFIIDNKLEQYKSYMLNNTLIFCNKLYLIWRGEKVG